MVYEKSHVNQISLQVFLQQQPELPRWIEWMPQEQGRPKAVSNGNSLRTSLWYPMETGVDHWADARSDARSMLTTIFFRKHLIRIGMLDTY